MDNKSPTFSFTFPSHLVINLFTLTCFKVEKPAVEPIVPKRPSVTFSREVDSEISGPALLISLAYLKSSEKLTVIVMKAKNLRPVGKSKNPGK